MFSHELLAIQCSGVRVWWDSVLECEDVSISHGQWCEYLFLNIDVFLPLDIPHGPRHLLVRTGSIISIEEETKIYWQCFLLEDVNIRRNSGGL